MDEYIKRMVDEFLSWTLPTDFVPDAGIRFYPPDAQYAHSWPTGTNLFTADQARAMFEHCAATLIEDLVRKDADCHSNGRRVTELEAELARVREELEIERAKFPAIGSPLQKLGALLADLLDADHFNNAEQYLLAAHADKERVALRAAEIISENHHEWQAREITPTEAFAQAMRESAS